MPIEASHALAAPMHIDNRADALRLCGRIEDTMEALLQLIEAESVLLRSGKNFAANALEARKNDFAQLYLADLRLLRVIGADLEYWVPEAVDRLRRLHEEFVSVLQIDMAALATARAVSDGRRTPPPARKSLPSAPGRAAPPVSIDAPSRRMPQRLAATRR